MRNFGTKVNDTAPLSSGILTAEEDNVRNQELENAVDAAGISLDNAAGPDSSVNMLAQAITRAASGALWCTDSGTANAYVATMAGNFVPPTALFDGLTIRMKIGNANTAASTLNAFGLGAKAVVDHVQAALITGVLDGRVAEFVYRSSIGAGSWQVPAWSNALFVGQTPSSPPAVSSGEGWLVNGSNQGDLNFAGLTADGAPLAADLFAFHDAVDLEHKAITYAQLGALLGTGGGILGIQFLTTSGTYVKTASTTKALVFAIGGGGGGAGAPSTYTAAGGGGGGMAAKFVNLSSEDNIVYTIGAGGAGGVQGNGSAGGSTTFGTHCTATGGGGGILTTGASTSLRDGRGGGGGVGTVGTILVAGSAGTNQLASTAGRGGSSWLGGGGRGAEATGLGIFTGENGGQYGGGGGGGDGDGAPGNGGAGAAGAILVVEFA